jgi:prepilin-type N-terminal cleavage/methylation domain-containing protein
VLKQRSAFTLLEVLISVALLTLILLGLNGSVDILRSSNQHLFDYLESAKDDTKVLDTLYKDIIGSDGNISISKDDFTRLCLEETVNSLYELPTAKVCWVVLKEENQLARVEGNGYELPVGDEQRVEVDTLTKNLELFDIYHNQKEGQVLVVIKEKGKEAMSFMVQGIYKPISQKKDIPTLQNPSEGVPAKTPAVEG